MKSFKYYSFLILIAVIISIFYPMALYGKIPIPADTIIGLYHPFRDDYAKAYPRGIPFKNSLITDPVRQQYPWKFISILFEQYQIIPLWNPYTLAGTPLLANMQSAPFYPLNLFLFLPDFAKWWGFFILLQPLLAGVFMYLYLRQINLNQYSAFLGGFTFAFCGFSVAWMEWGTIGHVALWLPLILLSIDKTIATQCVIQKNKDQKINRRLFVWSIIFLFSFTSSFLAGHLQTFFYVFIISFLYLLARWLQHGRNIKALLLFLILAFAFLFLTFIQWFPALQLILQSARDIDQIPAKEGWYLPVQHLIQFFAPDFFGNPATLNYWGIWNYGEFIAYVGIFPFIMALFAMFFRYDKKTLFFGSLFFLSLIFALPTWFARLPYLLNIPFINTAQPTRMLFITDFSLAVLSALGFDYYLRYKEKRKIIFPIAFLFILFTLLWIFIFISPKLSLQINAENISVAKSNLYFPSFILLLTSVIIFISIFINHKKLRAILIIILILYTIFDLTRFFYKFTPFTNRNYLYPDTASIFLTRKMSGLSRYMTTDARILPPNFSVMYFMQSIDGYDPLYIRRYGEFIVSMERNAPDIKPPFGFNRIINPHNYDSRLADLLGVKYVLSLTDLNSPKLQKALLEGETRVYENKNAFDRVFFVNKLIRSSGKQETLNAMFDKNIDLKNTAIVEGLDFDKIIFKGVTGKAQIIDYRSSRIVIQTDNNTNGFLVLTDTFYPTWHAEICNLMQQNCSETKIYLTDYNFRGILVPPGKHKIIFYITIF